MPPRTAPPFARGRNRSEMKRQRRTPSASRWPPPPRGSTPCSPRFQKRTKVMLRRQTRRRVPQSLKRAPVSSPRAPLRSPPAAPIRKRRSANLQSPWLAAPNASTPTPRGAPQSLLQPLRRRPRQPRGEAAKEEQAPESPATQAPASAPPARARARASAGSRAKRALATVAPWRWRGRTRRKWSRSPTAARRRACAGKRP
mmetsp:Transcript_32477/g.112352  ORF Transcript_32477/g.112352 Transcript_32477/m.112352 type:complete len:200 (+) Transcript_32477:872-1471(+)